MKTKSIPEQLIDMRKAKGATLKNIADLLQLTIGAVCNYEKGRRPIRATDFEKIKQYCEQ